jgi:transcriptional regulator PpsR
LTRRATQPADLGALSDCAAELAEAFVSLASDIALVIDERGTVTQVAQNSAAPVAMGAAAWVGRPWAETVTGDTRRKIELMLDDIEVTGVARRREVNLPGDGGDIPVAFTALRLGRGGPVIAVGRDLRAVAAIQQRFLDVQQEMERSYWRARQLESRYRLLFQVATDAVMTVEAHSLRVIEANHAAVGFFGGSAGGGLPLAGQVATQLFDGASRVAVHGLLDNARASGQPAEIHARLAGGSSQVAGSQVAVSATPFRASNGMRLLMRVRAQDPSTQAQNELSMALARLVDTTEDGIVITDSAGRITVANPAFITMVGAASEEAVHGRPIADWVGRIPEDVPALIAGVHGHGIARLVRTSLRRAPGTIGAHGAIRAPSAPGAIDVDVSAALLTEGDQECFGFTLRLSAEHKPAAAPDARRTSLLRSLAAIESELGSDSAPELVARGRRLLDQYLAQVALERAAGDTARAASLLGVQEDDLVRLNGESSAAARHG